MSNFSIDEIIKRARFKVWQISHPDGPGVRHAEKYNPEIEYPPASLEVEQILACMRKGEGSLGLSPITVRQQIREIAGAIHREAAARTKALHSAGSALEECLVYKLWRYKVDSSGNVEEIYKDNRTTCDGEVRLYLLSDDLEVLRSNALLMFPKTGNQMVIIYTPTGKRYAVFGPNLEEAIRRGAVPTASTFLRNVKARSFGAKYQGPVEII